MIKVFRSDVQLKVKLSCERTVHLEPFHLESFGGEASCRAPSPPVTPRAVPDLVLSRPLQTAHDFALSISYHKTSLSLPLRLLMAFTS